MWRLLSVLCIGYVTLPVISLASPPDTAAQAGRVKAAFRFDQRFEEAVADCVQIVRKQLPDTGFHAYSHESRVKLFGSPEAQFKFQKCMNRLGFSYEK